MAAVADLSVDACSSDLLNILQRYNRGLEDLLAETHFEPVLPTDEVDWERAARDFRQTSNKYRTQLQDEQSRWIDAEAATAEASCRLQQEVHHAIVACWRNSGDPTRELREQRDRRMEAMRAEFNDVLTAEPADLVAEEEANSTTMCASIVVDLRLEWRGQQRKRLQLVAERLRAERGAAAEALEKLAARGAEATRSLDRMWATQVSDTRAELDSIAQEYEAALKDCLSAKLKAINRHASDQQDFYEREIKEATDLERAEGVQHSGQVRRMRLAMLKWRQDYLQDAQGQALEVAGLRRAAEAQRRRWKSAGEDAATADARADEKRLRACREVLGRIWEHLPGEQEMGRRFLQRLESRIPFTEEVLWVYQDHLEEHGVMPALQRDPPDADEDDD